MKALQVDPAARYQRAGDMAFALEQLAADFGMPLGHGAVTGSMKQLFSERRRRFARSSSDVKAGALPGRRSGRRDHADHTDRRPETPVTPIDPVRALEPAEPVTVLNAPMPIEHDETTEPREIALDVLPPPLEPQVRYVRASSVQPPPQDFSDARMRSPTPTGQLPRVFQPSPFAGTALIRRAERRRMFEPWWIAIGVFVIALIAAILR